MSKNNNTDHVPVVTTIALSPFQKRMLKKISEDNGKNVNNCATVNHGINVLFFNEMDKRKIKVRKEYTNI